MHTSIAGSLERAALKAADLGANTFQIFSASPRMWRAGEPDPLEIRKLAAARERFDLTPLVIHDNYLINLAAEDPRIRAMSVEAFRSEVRRALAIGAEYLVAHPGSYGGQGLERGICALVESLRDAVSGLEMKRLMLLIENTAGGGTKLGGCFEELRAMRELAANYAEVEIGFCLDTAHLLASGYDVASAEGLRDTVRRAGRVLGLENVRVIHANDSKTPLGSHVDRHQHIGEGFIGAEGFRRILRHPKLRTKPFILETPRDREGDDRRNMETLKSLCRKRITTTKPSN
ncbi:MAG: deoxyribonuclease IV [Rhodospirillales bacterium]